MPATKHCITPPEAISFALDPQHMACELRITGHSRREKELAALLKDACALAMPTFACRTVKPVFLAENTLLLEGLAFESKVLCRILQRALASPDNPGMLFAFVASCGQELETWASSLSGRLHEYWAKAIMKRALRTAIDAVKCVLAPLGNSDLSRIEPGIPIDWPVTEQKKLFALLEPCGSAGVRLNEQCMMQPLYSMAGIYFFTKTVMTPCAYCRLRTCYRRDAIKPFSQVCE